MIEDQLAPKEQPVKTPFKCNADDYAHTTYENLDDLKDIVDFEVEGEENVVITKNTTYDPWLNKLVGNGTFIGQTDDATANLGGRFIYEENDPEDDIVDPKFKAKKNICYPSFDRSTPWDQCKPVLGMKFENPQQLKNIDVSEGKCAAFKGKKAKDKNNDVEYSTNSDKADSISKPDDAKCSSKPATKKNEQKHVPCMIMREGLVEHYSKLWEYRQGVLESNPGSTCQLETKDRDDGKIYFKRMYTCFKGQLLTAIEDLELGYCGGLTVISDGHKGLIKVVAGATSCTVKQQFLQKMEQIKELDPAAHKWIVPAIEARISEGITKELSGIPCIHAMAAYYHINMYPELGVNEFLSKQSWYNAYQYSIRPVLGSILWKTCDNPAPLPPIERKRPGRPRKQRIRHPTEDDNHVSRVEEYQHKMDMEALAEVQREIAAEEAEQERIRQIWAENEANDLYWENMAKEFRDDELNRLEDSLEAAYSFDTISEFQDNEVNVHQVSMDLPVNEAPENYTTEESRAQDPDLKPTIPTQESQIHTRSKIRKQVAATTSIRIYVKNRGTSERIAKMKAKNFKFDANGTGSTADKTFDVSEDEEKLLMLLRFCICVP
ncbi:hypothetical protein Tco_1167742, partial [Tanacetum coccineum]